MYSNCTAEQSTESSLRVIVLRVVSTSGESSSSRRESAPPRRCDCNAMANRFQFKCASTSTVLESAIDAVHTTAAAALEIVYCTNLGSARSGSNRIGSDRIGTRTEHNLVASRRSRTTLIRQLSSLEENLHLHSRCRPPII